jgi:glycosyltransferase involved in cell wall biosynthesis
LNNQKKILYIISGETGYKKTDEIILRSLGNVRKLNYKSGWNYIDPKLLLNLIWCNTIVVWFASFHAFPVILLNYFFNKRLIIIAGGFDVANVPNINYGAMRGKSRAKLGKWLLSRAHSVIAVSKSNRQEIIENGNVAPKKISLIYNAIPETIITHTIEKKNQVLTIGEINEETYLRKGLDRFIEIAKKMPTIQFIHIGKWTDKKGNPNREIIDYVKSISPSNICYLGFVDKKELEKYYEVSKIYLQLSRHEAFGVSVVEAMTYGCIPIVSNAYALPEVINGRGYVVQNIQEIIPLAKQILNEDFKLAKVKNPFPIFQREKGFRKILVY